MAKKQTKKPENTLMLDKMPNNEKERLQLMIKLNEDALSASGEYELDEILRTQIASIKERIAALKS